MEKRNTSIALLIFYHNFSWFEDISVCNSVFVDCKRNYLLRTLSIWKKWTGKGGIILCNPEKVDPQAKTRCKRVEHTLNSTQTLYLCATKINVNLMTIQTNTHWLCCVTWYVISLFFNKCAFSILFYVAPRILVGASSNRILKLEYAPNSVKSPCPQNS